MQLYRDERGVKRRAMLSSALAGAALAAAAMAGGSAVLAGAGATASGVAVVVASMVGSLLIGLWAGAPASARAELPIRERWVSAGIAFALAGAVATMWQIYAIATISSFGRVLGLLAMVSAPAYALGLIFPLVLASASRILAEGEESDEADEADEASEARGGLGEVVVGALAGFAIMAPVVGVLLLPSAGVPPLLLATSVILLVPLLQSDADEAPAHETVLREVHTPLATLRVTEVAYPGERQPERRLYLGDEQESGELVRSGAPTLAYVASAESWLTRDIKPGRRYLFLGGGAYTLPRRIAERDPTASITVVELDPEVTRLAYRYFGVRPDHRIVTVTGDARAYVESNEGEVFDRIYVDVYAGSEAVPYHLVTREAFAALRDRLAPGGAIAVNLIGVTDGPEAVRMWTVVRTVADVLPVMALYTHLGPDFTDLQNLLLLASTDQSQQFPDAAGLMDRWPSSQWRLPESASVLRDLYPTSVGRAASAPSASLPGSAG